MGNAVTPEQRDADLSVAAEEGKAKEVGNLLKKGADPNKPLADGELHHRTSLHRAAKTKNNVDVLTKLLDHVKNVDATDDDGNTALHLAAGYYNNAAFVHTLLQAKPNCKIQNSKGQTALHSAVQNGTDWKVVELLLLADSDPNIPDFEGNTPLHLCAAKRATEDIVPGILLRFGADPNLKNEEGQTALHVAAKSGNKVVLLLLKFHAKVRLKDKVGKRASEVAETEEIKEILLYEEEALEKRTFRSDYQGPMTSQPPHTSMYSDISNYTNNYYYGNGAVSPNGKGTHFWAADLRAWRGCGGDGVIHLPNKSDIVVPPQAVPCGTTFKVNIKASKKHENEELPEFDFELYDFDFEVKLDLPGTLLLAPWMSESSASLGKISSNVSSPPAFTGFCAEGENRWKCYREMACQPNGVVAMHFKLTREKGQAMRYKMPPPNRRSTAEINMTRIRQSPPTIGGNDVFEEENKVNGNDEASSMDESSLSLDDEEMRVGRKEESDCERREESSGDERNEGFKAERRGKEESDEKEGTFDAVMEVLEEMVNDQTDRKVLAHDSSDEETCHDEVEEQLPEDFLDYPEFSRYQHPIDPALATIVEDSKEDFANDVNDSDNDETNLYNRNSPPEEITMDDLVNHKLVVLDKL